ncbi:SAM-dependent methyltransferase, type 11 [Citrifermentans bemidjiense Bem]|uniref:SAM-dependent methyltransferase, type 11 n=1 Tax=Citrifermentans bemidjiense (strain ATCC BAA-1014 / DSM 16622 / JCM 12645 / Bem) TaxID=404380 RepID=B5EDU5_CITBB|nr:class I SAM-dependent methyltransferase [Citrifermentans bemidjiense]ACH40723.1 SAM-dependent methyltransferase, type 11 [Citrifermentans bemidjiense Bem]
MYVAYNDFKRLSEGDEIKDYKKFYRKLSNTIEFGGAFTNYDFLVKYRFMNIFQNVYNVVLRRHPSNILDIGCGNGVNLPLSNVFKFVDYHGLDYADKAIENAQKEYPNVTFHVQDAFNTDFEDKSFDMIILASVLILYREEKDRVNLLTEIKRILADDGVFVLVVWKESLFLKASMQFSRALGKLLGQNVPNDFMAVYFSTRDIAKLAKKVDLKISETIHTAPLYGVLESVRHLNMSKFNRKYGKSESESAKIHSQTILKDLQDQAGSMKSLTSLFYYLAKLFPNMFSHYSVYVMEKK